MSVIIVYKLQSIIGFDCKALSILANKNGLIVNYLKSKKTYSKTNFRNKNDIPYYYPVRDAKCRIRLPPLSSYLDLSLQIDSSTEYHSPYRRIMSKQYGEDSTLTPTSAQYCRREE